MYFLYSISTVQNTIKNILYAFEITNVIQNVYDDSNVFQSIGYNL